MSHQGRAHWAAMLPLVQAYIEGKTIQIRWKQGSRPTLATSPGPWSDVDFPTFSDHSCLEWRIKP